MRWCIGLMSLVVAAWAVAEEPGAKTAREEFETLVQKYRNAPNLVSEDQNKRNAAANEVSRAILARRPPAEIKALRDALPSLEDARAQTEPRAHRDGFLKLIEKYPRDAVALEALEWLLEFDEGGPQTRKAVEAIHDEALQSERASRACAILTARFSQAGDEFLRRVVETSPQRTVKAMASRSQALRLARKVDWAKQEAASSDILRDELAKRHRESIENYDQAELLKSGAAKAEALFTRAATVYGDVVFSSGTRFPDLIEADLRELRTLSVGCAAPEIEGLDMDGKPMKLSDARGHVVLLEFWGTWCGPCMALVPEHSKLVQRMEDKPFLLVGVNSDADRAAAKQQGRERGITWRSWFDGGHQRHGDGPIHRAWSIDSWPTMYLIDAHGTIRFKGHLLRGSGEITDPKRFNPALPPTPVLQKFSYLEDCAELLVKEAEAARANGSVTVGTLVPVKVRPSARSVLPPFEVSDQRKLTVLAAYSAVHKELGVSVETAEKLTALQEEYFETLRDEYEAKGVSLGGLQRQSDLQAKFQIVGRLDLEFGRKIKELLTEQQFHRLHQIRVQAMSNSAFNDREITQELALTKVQIDALMAIYQEMWQKSREIISENRQATRAENEAKLREMNVERDKRVAEILTADQNAKFAEMRGEPFDLNSLRSVRPATVRKVEDTRGSPK